MSIPAEDPQPNPYRAPTAASTSFVDESSGGVVTARILELLAQTRPWVRFFSVLLFIAAGLMFIMAPAVVFLGDMGPMQRAAGIVYFVFACVYIPPAVYLGRYAGRINELLASRGVSDLEGALQAQKSFWRFVGIVAAVILILYVFALVALATIGVSQGLRHQ